MKGRKRALVALALLAGLLLSCAALARPGSGESFSGGSSPSGGGGGDGGEGLGVLLELLLWLCIEHPSVGIPLTLLVLVGLVVRAALQRGLKAWSSGKVDVARVQKVERRAPSARRELEALREVDPELSVVLFEDFAYMLYGAVQRARGVGTGWLAAYLDPTFQSRLQQPELADVQGIVIGALRYVRVRRGAQVEVELALEANYVEVSRSGAQQRWYVVDRLTLARSASARSRPFARAHKLDCPNCGAPLEALRGTECSYCQQSVGLGRFDWMVTSLINRTREPRGPLLTKDVPETGTDKPTIIDAGAQAAFTQLAARDPSLSWQSFTHRIAHVFAELQVAWAGRDPLRIRPYVSDNLFQSLYYWIDLYVQARCRNVTEGARILRIDLARVSSDKHYDSITVRVFATSTDYVISDDGKVLRGSRSRQRSYSEYWTWIRGSERKGATRGDLSCPNCGAPLRVGMSGSCEYCRVKVTAGEFDWVLSRIEQDDSYSG